MSYCTPAQIRLALDPSGDGTTPGSNTTAASMTDVQLQDAIAQADSDVDLYLSTRYATPVQPLAGTLNAVVANLSRDIAAYYATLTWRKGKDLQEQDPVVRRYNAAMTRLVAISRGQASLDIPAQSDSGASGQAGQALNQYSGSLFSANDVDLRQPSLGWPDVRDRYGL